ncbi:ATP-binding protein [Chitinophaga lutea]
MKRRQRSYVIFLILVFSATGARAQSTVGDSAHVAGLIAVAERFFTASRYDSALHYCQLAEQYSRRNNYRKGIAYAIVERTDILMDKGDLGAAEAQARQSQVIGAQLRDAQLAAITQMQLAQVRMYGGRYDEAVPYFERSIVYFATHPSRYAALAYNDFGYTYGMKGDLKNKADCLLRSVGVYESLGEGYDGEKAAAYNNLATLYYELKQPDKTIEYAKRSIVYREKSGDVARLSLGCCNLSQFYLGVDAEEARRYQQLCVKYALQSGDEARIIHSYVTSSLIASAGKDPAAAIDYERKAIALLEKSGRDPIMLSRRYIAAGMAYMHTDSTQAAAYFEKARQLAGAQNDKFNLRDLYYQLTLFYKSRGDFERAYTNYNRHILYRDSIIKDRTATDIADLEKKYETEKKDNLIARLHAAQEIKALQIEKQEALLAGNHLEAEKRQREIDLLSKETALQHGQLERQALEAKNAQQQLELAAREKQLQERQLKSSRTTRNFLLAGLVLLCIIAWFLFSRYQLKRKIQEQEALLAVRNNIAKDLHDEIGSTLTSIKILSEVSGRSLYKDSGKALAFIHKISEQSAAAQQGISDIVWAVKPENDKLENMVIRMREYAAQTLESKNVRTEIHIDEPLLGTVLDMQQRRDFFLIYKEAVNNIAKHAGASLVTVHIGAGDGRLRLRVSDDGAGFDTAVLRTSSGLQNMRSRAAALHGALDVTSRPGEGTVVDLQLPVT